MTTKSQNKSDGGKQPNKNDKKDETTKPKSSVCPDKKRPKNDNQKCSTSEIDHHKSASNDFRPLPSNASEPIQCKLCRSSKIKYAT